MGKGKGGTYKPQLKGNAAPEAFANPESDFSTEIGGMDSMSMQGGEAVGFTTTGYINKEGTPYGESVKLNYMPPGMDISNQENVEINMKMKTVVSMSYPGDGWSPTPGDISE
jgi:hypothetical protein